MRFNRKLVVGGVLASALGMVAVAWAHNGPGGEHGRGQGMGGTQMGMHGGAMHGMGGTHGMGGMGGMGMQGGAAALDSMKDALKLTAEQAPAWEKYAEVVRRQTEARVKMREAMHSGNVEHGAMHDTMSAFRREAAKELTQARDAFAAVLSAEQRQTFEARGPGRGRGHGGRMAQGGEHRH